ncbi:MAG: Gmad2 immunoglobulin-like domain-containing protein [Candidatus Uhrbacteria bacterium]
MKRISLISASLALILSLSGAGCATETTVKPPVTNQPVTTTQASTTIDNVIITKGDSENVRLTTPVTGSKIPRPLLLAGEARGWYFEGSFPVRILNQYGVRIAQGFVEADGDWMTTDWVPFVGQLDYPAQPAGTKGTIVLSKDNPSGLPEHDASISVPIIF